MTKQERLSYALRRLRQVTAQGNTALRIEKTHEIIKEMIEAWSKGTKSADVGEHTTRLLDDLYAQNLGVIEDGRLPAPPVMLDCADQIQAQTQALQAITSEHAQTHRSETEAVLRDTLSLFAQGPNEAPMEAFLDTFDERIKWANALPTPMPDGAEQMALHTEALSQFESIEDPNEAHESAVSILRNALSVFAQGPNQQPIEAFLDTFHERIKWPHARPTPMPDGTEQMALHTDTLSHLGGIDNAHQILAVSVDALCSALSVFAQGPNEQPIETLLRQVEQTLERAKALPPPWPDCSSFLQPHLERLEALVDQDNPEAIGEVGTTILYRVLSAFAQGPNEEPIQTLLAAVEMLDKQKEMGRLLRDDTPKLEPHIEALTALEGLDDPDALTAAAAMTLYETLAGMARGPQEASIRALLDTFDKVTGAA